MFEVLLAAASFLGGGIASVAGFGIGSVLTPIFAMQAGTRVAVAAVSIPHVLATLVRFRMLRREIDRKVLVNFGILSVAGGLTGALLHAAASNAALSFVFAGLLLFAGAVAMAGRAGTMRFGRKTAWVAGAVSGMLGGLVGNQGGIRSAALLGFGLERRGFVATATAIGLIVDAARMPVYFATSGTEMAPLGRLIAISVLGTLAGTLFGARLLHRIPERIFQRVIGATIFALGGFMAWQAAVR